MKFTSDDSMLCESVFLHAPNFFQRMLRILSDFWPDDNYSSRLSGGENILARRRVWSVLTYIYIQLDSRCISVHKI